MGLGSGSGSAPENPLPLSGIGKASANILAGQRWEIGHDLVLAHTRREVGENISDGDTRPTNCGFPEADLGIDDDPIMVVLTS